VRRAVVGQRKKLVVTLGELGPPPFVLTLPLKALAAHHVDRGPCPRWTHGWLFFCRLRLLAFLPGWSYCGHC